MMKKLQLSIEDEKLQYDSYREALPSDKIDKYEYLTREENLLILLLAKLLKNKQKN